MKVRMIQDFLSKSGRWLRRDEVYEVRNTDFLLGASFAVQIISGSRGGDLIPLSHCIEIPEEGITTREYQEMERRLEEALEVAQEAEKAYEKLKIERDALRRELDILTGITIVEDLDPREILLSTYRLYVARGDKGAMDLMERAADMPNTQGILDSMRAIRLGVSEDELPF